MGHALGLYRAGAARSARGQPGPVGAQPDRSVHPRAPRTRRADAVARSRQDGAAAPRDLDLTGLPPTPAEVDAFLADRSPDAYEKRVDALLQSPRYGERMAVPWLDAARYADTHGFHIDSLRGMWPWRDWVIDAFNRNMPFDQFAIEQLAGDLLPDATRAQNVATGFNRNHMINFEGGAIAEEYRVEYVIDRVETTSSAFMGLTMGCARCHAHKYDPITQKEFYQFFAFFNTVPEVGLDGRVGNARPFLQLTVARAAGQDRRAQRRHHHEGGGARGRRRGARAERVGADDFRAFAAAGADGLTAHYELDGNFSDISGRYQHGRTITGDPTFDAGRVGKAASIDGDTEVSFGNVGSFDRTDGFSLAVWMRGRGNLPISVFQKLDDAERRRGYEWKFDDIVLDGIQRWAARLNITLASDSAADAIQIRTRERLFLGDWYHVAMTYDGSGKAAGLRLFVDGEQADVGRGAGHADRIDQNRRAAPAREQSARQAVHRADRRPPPLQPRADSGADRAARAPLRRPRHSLGRDRQAVEGRGRPGEANTSSPTRRPTPCGRCTSS